MAQFFALANAFSLFWAFLIALFDFFNSEEGESVLLIKGAEKAATIVVLEGEGRGSGRGRGRGEADVVSNNGAKTGNAILELEWVVVEEEEVGDGTGEGIGEGRGIVGAWNGIEWLIDIVKKTERD